MNVLDQAFGQDYVLYQGDAVEVTKGIPDNSVDFTIHSPPFSSLYIYGDSDRDFGNCSNDEEFFQHYDFLIPELLRVTRPGRLCAVHCKQLVNYKGRDGAAGLRDFRGEIIRHFDVAGWQYHSEVCIWKDPVIEMQRTKAHGLLYKQLCADSTFSRQGLAEYLVIFRKWPQTEEEEAQVIPVTHAKDKFPSTKGIKIPRSAGKIGTHITDTFPLEIWQRYASPVWFDIQQTDVLNIEQARESRDEKHICPLQKGVIYRALELWTNKGDTVLDPFNGIGSSGYVALEMERKYIGVELKDSYFNTSIKHLQRAERQKTQATLFDDLMIEEVTA